MRIISGSKRGAIIKAPSGLPVRPITDRNKESLFNILANYIDFEGISVLDLFSGTGNIAFEFASRGAGMVIAVDQHRGCANFIAREARRLNFENLFVERGEVLRFISAEYRHYDVIVADPPFKWEHYEEMTRKIFEEKLLKPGGFFVTEHYQNLSLDHLPNFMEVRKYGQNRMSFFRELPAED